MSPKIRVNASEWSIDGCESWISQLALALKFVDRFSEQDPIGHLFFSVDGKRIALPQNQSGYYLILDSNPLKGDQTLTIESDYYLITEEVLHIPDLTVTPLALNPVVRIYLDPGPQYPFPSHATLVRGSVKGVAPDSVCEVKVKGLAAPAPLTRPTSTDPRGDFVLFFKGIKEEGEDISIVISKCRNEIERQVKILPRTIASASFEFP